MKQKTENCREENTSLDTELSNVFVVTSSKKRAFIEYFNSSSVNFTQKDLGTILGFFIIRNETSTSENIVNFLASEAKKKYFIPNNKTSEEKFELTLHHINRALEEIANIGNVDWLGNIDGAVCVVDDASLHFSITGEVHILLLRDNVLMNISEGSSSEDAKEHPIKTFVDISSGELCVGDKIIITSKELLDLVSFSDLEKNAIRFGQKNFIQFIETVLTNECNLATTTIIDINQKEIPNVISQQRAVKTTTNAFGADAFEDVIDLDSELSEVNLDEDADVSIELEQDLQQEYTDPRTGHIHIQGSDEPIAEPTFSDSLKEQVSDKLELFKNILSKNKKLLSKKITSIKTKSDPEAEQVSEIIDNDEEVLDYFDDVTSKEDTAEIAATKKTKTKTAPTTSAITTEYDHDVEETHSKPDLANATKVLIQRICIVTKDVTKTTTIKCLDIISNVKTNRSVNKNLDVTTSSTSSGKKTGILPSANKITRLWHDMNTKHKIIAIAILIAIIVIPIIFSTISRDETPAETLPEEVIETAPTEEIGQVSEPDNKNTISDPVTLFENDSLVSTIQLNDRLFGVSKDRLTLLADGKKKDYKLPSDADDIKLVTPMKDLDLIFFLTLNNKLYSFSPITAEFKEQKNIPEIDVTDIDTLGTYMTYLYTTDDTMINRYARIENGFTNGEDWLKKDANLKETTSLAIDDDIYTATDTEVKKFSNHKESSFNKNTTIKDVFLIYSTPTTKNMWLLDRVSGKLLKTTKGTGKPLTDFTHSNFKDATSLTVDESNNKAFITTSDKLFSFSI